MKLRDLLAGISPLSVTADLETEICGVSYDSRKTRPGDLFVAMTGFETDGPHYVWWTDEPPTETEVDGQTAYEFQLLYGQDADDGLPPEQTANPMAGRLAAIYAVVAKDGSACWEYGIGTDTWTSLS